MKPHLIAPALLALTALVQIGLALAGPLTPWKGGGFGLFSSVDRLENRILLAWEVTATGERPLDPRPGGLEREMAAALSLPTASRLQRLGRLLAERDEVEGDLRVEVWKRTFDPASGELRRVRVAREVVRAQ